jgi:hypothetical protein
MPNDVSSAELCRLGMRLVVRMAARRERIADMYGCMPRDGTAIGSFSGIRVSPEGSET